MAERIVTLGTAITETVDALGLGTLIVATDVTSEHPAYIKKLPKVSRNRSLSVEGLMQFQPDLVLAQEGDISSAVLTQLKKIGVKVISIHQEFSVKGAERFIMDVAGALQVKQQGELLVQQMRKSLKPFTYRVKNDTKPTVKVLFIYVRGAVI